MHLRKDLYWLYGPPDFYKGPRICQSLEELSGWKFGSSWHSAATNNMMNYKNTSVPVSYTHLDVYKRQRIHLYDGHIYKTT